MKNISILGCGWFGFSLAKRLVEKGYQVKGSTTRRAKFESLHNENIKPYLINFGIENQYINTDFFASDILIIAIPPKRRAGENAAYPHKIQSICQFAAAQGNIKHLLYISSSGVYPNVNKTFIESDLPKPDTEASKLLVDAENIVKSYAEFSTTLVRFGGLYGGERNPARFFGSKRDIPNGLAPVNLIHLDDCVGVIEAILDRKAFGHIYHACSPDHPARKDFYSGAAQKTGIEPPTFINELANWKIIDSVNVPLYLNYTYKVSLF